MDLVHGMSLIAPTDLVAVTVADAGKDADLIMINEKDRLTWFKTARSDLKKGKILYFNPKDLFSY